MDAAGKDGAIKHVMSGVNPQGCQVFSFKHPSAEELDHDFLWRTHQVPARARADRHLQSVLLRGSAHRPGASRDPAAARGSRTGPTTATHLEGTLSLDRRPRTAPAPQRHAHRQVLPAPLEGGAAQALPGADRRSGKELEIQPRPISRSAILAGRTWRPTSSASAPRAPATPRGTSFPPMTRERPADRLADHPRHVRGLDLPIRQTTAERRQELLTIRQQLEK